jgi:hypothetical protein
LGAQNALEYLGNVVSTLKESQLWRHIILVI